MREKSNGVRWPAMDSEMADRIRTFDWASTPLGSIETWPQSLRSVVDVCLDCCFAFHLFYGPELTQIYNDAFAEFAGPLHPAALGKPVYETWPDSRKRRHIHLQVLSGQRLRFENELIPLS